jgi:hypothetical protein
MGSLSNPEGARLTLLVLPAGQAQEGPVVLPGQGSTLNVLCARSVVLMLALAVSEICSRKQGCCSRSAILSFTLQRLADEWFQKQIYAASPRQGGRQFGELSWLLKPSLEHVVLASGYVGPEHSPLKRNDRQ